MHLDLEYQFTYKTYSRKFAVECKFRSNMINDVVEFAKPDQFNRYKEFQSKTKMDVYVILGIGGSSNDPQQLFIIPITKINSGKLVKSELMAFNKSLDRGFYYSTKNHKLI